MKQVTLSKSNYIEKILRDADGRLVRATFCVYENGGRIKARLVSAVYIEENIATENKIPLLNFTTLSVVKYQKASLGGKITSPYFNSSLLYSLGSKPRAPTR